MAVQATLDYRLSTNSPTGIGIGQTNQSRWTPGAGAGQRQTISLPASTFTAIPVPSGAKVVILILGGAVSLVLKGITGDSNSMTLTPATNPLGIDAMFPAGPAMVFGLLNNALVSQSIEALFL